MLRIVQALAVLGLVLLASTALACSTPAPKPPEVQFQHASAVFFGELLTSRRLRPPPDGKEVEVAEFRVVKAWRGPFRKGQIVTFTTPIELMGTCVRNVLNDPKWMDGEDGEAAIFPTTWIIYVAKLDELVLDGDLTEPMDGPMLRREMRALDRISRRQTARQ